MKDSIRALERALLVLFVASGFAGLIYQAIWSHYLGLTLGHAAYAQTLVLAIFMGGMALGAWLVSRRGVHWRRLILVYALVELAIGAAGLAFHPLFVAYTGLSQEVVYPGLSNAGAIRAWQWGSAALLIAPQSVLLGMTFPLMSGAYLRVAPRADGEILGGLYFSNSIGAAFGALFATFVLLPAVGMPGTVAVAGVVNLIVGAFAWILARRVDAGIAIPAGSTAAPEAAATADDAVAGGDRGFYRMMIVAAAITGASSFVYEIGWVRMLNQALGTTVHSFELMLAAFILGLAFGGLWIRKRSRRIADAAGYAGYAQVLMGVAALVSLPVFAQSFRWVGALMQAVPRTDDGYALFSLGSAGIALLVMFPAAFFAGMTLPLFTVALLRRGHGEASIGRIYAANTLGAIVGVVLAVHVLVPVLGLHLAVALAALADIVLGLVLLRRFATNFAVAPYFTALVGAGATLALALVFGRPDPTMLVSGVFRTGSTQVGGLTEVSFLRDGKTATVAVYRQGNAGTIATNGKPDASLMLDASDWTTDDEITMVMAAALPLGLHPHPDRIAVIGWGSGLTTHSLLGSSEPDFVDTVEIERAMVDGASLFRSRVDRAYSDPRSRLHIDDARTYFSSGQRRYDVIVSEPSNPWVSGVASLFTRQFYAFLGRHLEDDGLLVQWVQVYELNDPLFATMMAALLQEFPHADAYLTNHGDLLLVASRRALPPLRFPASPGSPFAAELRRVGLDGTPAFASRRLGSRDFLQTLVRLNGAVPHDDFHPVVSLQAPRARFKRELPRYLFDVADVGMPVLEMTDGRRPPPVSASVPLGNEAGMLELRAAGLMARSMLLGERPKTISAGQLTMFREVEALLARTTSPIVDDDVAAWIDSAAVVAELTIAPLPAVDQRGTWLAPAWIDLDGQPEIVRTLLAAYAAAAGRDAPAMRRLGLEALTALQARDEPPGLAHEQMLVIAMLGALGEGDDDGAVQIERTRGRGVPVNGNSRYGAVRAFLLAWADRGEGR